MITNVHKPIMVKEISSFLNNDKELSILDCTFGGGGHTISFLDLGHRVTAIDEDLNAQKIAKDLRTQFNNFDTDGSGDIDLDELTYIVRNHMKRKDLSRDDLKDMMKEFDHQRNGSIQFIGFLERVGSVINSHGSSILASSSLIFISASVF